jgi:hypothetical protein
LELANQRETAATKGSHAKEASTAQDCGHEIAIRDVEERAASIISTLTNQLEDVTSQVGDAIARAAAAESANAELSQKLARIPEVSSSKESDLNEIKVVEGGTIGEDASKSALRVEAAETAAMTAYRRATAAEEQVETLKVMLEKAEKKAKEMAWQVKMLSEGPSPERSSSAGAGRLQKLGVGMLDVLGCAMNYSRRSEKIEYK